MVVLLPGIDFSKKDIAEKVKCNTFATTDYFITIDSNNTNLTIF